MIHSVNTKSLGGAHELSGGRWGRWGQTCLALQHCCVTLEKGFSDPASWALQGLDLKSHLEKLIILWNTKRCVASGRLIASIPCPPSCHQDAQLGLPKEGRVSGTAASSLQRPGRKSELCPAPTAQSHSVLCGQLYCGHLMYFFKSDYQDITFMQ